MRIKLVDSRTEHSDDVEYGTCELCMHTGPGSFTTITLEDYNGRYDLDLFFWCWGDLFEISIDNLANFSVFLSKFHFDNDYRLDYADLDTLASGYKSWAAGDLEGFAEWVDDCMPEYFYWHPSEKGWHGGNNY